MFSPDDVSAQIRIPRPTAVRLPSEAMLDLHPLAQFRPAERGCLAFIAMYRDAATVSTRRTAGLERTRRATVLWEVNRLAQTEGNHDLVRAGDRRLLPIQGKRGFREAAAVADRPGFAVDRQLGGTLLHPVTGEIRAIEVQLTEDDLLRGQVRIQIAGDGGLGRVGGGDADGADQAGIQSVEDMTLLAVDALATALAPVAHLGIFKRNAALFGDPPPQGRLPLLIFDHILGHDLAHRRLTELHDLWGRIPREHRHDRVLVEPRRAGAYRSQHLARKFRQLPPLLVGDHAQGLRQSVAQKVNGPRQRHGL